MDDSRGVKFGSREALLAVAMRSELGFVPGLISKLRTLPMDRPQPAAGLESLTGWGRTA